MLACGDSADPLACSRDCRVGGIDSHVDEGFMALLGCLSTECDPTCGTCGATDIYLNPRCEECLKRTSGGCEGMAGCVVEDECGVWLICTGSCEDPPCVMECPEPTTEAFANVWAALPAVVGSCSEACALGGSWGCVGDYSWGGVREAQVTFRIHVADTVTTLPVAGATVSLCFSADPACEPPHATATTGDDGVAALTADIGAWPAGFPGHFLASGPPGGPDYVPTLGVQTMPLVVGQEARLQLMPRETLAGLVGMVTPEAPAEGTPVVFTTVFDCQGFPSAGVVVASTPPAQVVYLAGQLPAPSAAATDISGTAVLPAVPLGAGETAAVTLSAALEADATTVASAVVMVRKGHITAVQMHPLGLR